LREWESVRNSITSLIDPARVAVEEAIAAASGYPELAQEVKAVESRLRNGRSSSCSAISPSTDGSALLTLSVALYGRLTGP